jgi:hypothetical protein
MANGLLSIDKSSIFRKESIMAYCRIGEDSELYLWKGGSVSDPTADAWYMTIERTEGDEVITATKTCYSLEELDEMLTMLLSHGAKIPEYAISRVKRELNKLTYH